MNLLQITRDQFRHLFALAGKARALTPREFTTATAAFLLSQFFLVLSFFLPLKAVLLLAIEGIPWYLDGLVTMETKDNLVLGIAAAAVGSYGLHVLSNRLVNQAVVKGSQHIVGKSNKLRLFNNQADVAGDGYRRLCQAIGSIVIVLLGLALGLVINPLLFVVFAVIVAAEYGALYVLMKSATPFGRRLNAYLGSNFAAASNFLAAGNFLVGFVIMFAQFLAIQQRNMIIAILSILLLRQLTQRIRIGVQDLAFLWRNGSQLNALFFDSVPYTPLKQNYSFLSVLSISDRNQWLSSALSAVLKESDCDIRSQWLDSDMPGVAYFEIEIVAGQGVGGPLHTGNGSSRYLVKCYDSKRALGAAHEIHLFTAMSESVPVSPRYLGNALVGEARVLVFEGLPSGEMSASDWRLYGLQALFELWSVEPNSKLLGAYLRTHPTIAMRLNSERLSQMWLAADDRKDNDILKRFFDLWPDIRSKIERLPPVVHNPGLTPHFCRMDAGRGVRCFSWNRWSIEPIGCSNLLLRAGWKDLDAARARLASEGMQIEASNEDLWLVSRLFGLETALNRNRLREALEVAGEMTRLAEDNTSTYEARRDLRVES